MKRPLPSPAGSRPAVALALLALAAGCRATGLPLDPFEQAPRPYEIELAGNETFDRGRLLGEIRTNLDEFIESGFRKHALDDAAYALESFYRAQGFPAARVEYEYAPAEGVKPRVLLRVSEGVRCELRSVRFEGNTVFGADELRALVPTGAGGLLPAQVGALLGGREPTWLVMSRLEAARGGIVGLYYERGHLDVRVDPPQVAYVDERRGAEVSFTLHEGVAYRLAGITLEGLPEEWHAELARSCDALTGRPWFPRLAYEIRARVLEHCAGRGRPDARIATEEQIDSESGDVHLLLRVEPGPLVHVRSLLLCGNVRTRARFIHKRVALAAGDLYDRRKERETFRALYGTGLFDRVRIELQEREDETEGAQTERDLLVEVHELPSLELYVEPGYGSYEQARVTLGLSERNLLGQGRRLRLEGTLAELAQRAELGLTDPWLLGPQIVIDSELFVGERQEPSFTRLEHGGSLRLLRSWTREFETTVGYEFRSERAADIQVADPDTLAAVEDVDLSIVSFSPVYDSRDGPFLPAGGTLARVGIEVSDELIGSQIEYVRLTGSAAHYWRLDERSVLAASARTGLLFDTGDLGGTDEFPLTVRFFNGGENSVRSFRESELGPHDANGQPIGGEAFSVLSLEYRRDLAGRFQGALFYDVGNVAARVEDYTEFAGLRSALGAGLRWLLPIGPVRLDLGVNPDPDRDEKDYVLHFSVGVAF